MAADTGELETEVILIHFDLPDHRIPLDTFVRTAKSTQAIVHSFNREFFDSKVRFEIFILPPEAGTFKSKIGVALLGGWAVIWSFTESDIGKSFIKGLTTHEPAYWSEIVGVELRKKLRLGETSPLPEESKQKIAATILAETTKGFLQTNEQNLKKIGIQTSKFRDAFEARNEFYQACLDTPDIKALGFEENHKFPIDRKEFERLQVTLPAEGDDVEPWITGIATLKVTSPNWDPHDQSRGWKARDARGRERYFRIEDEHFWQLVHIGHISTHIIDTIEVQWAHQGVIDSPKHIRVLRVLIYNEQFLSEPLDGNALSAILGSYTHVLPGQGDLFDVPPR